MVRTTAVLALTLLLGCARGIVDEGEGSTTHDVPRPTTPPSEEPAPARRVSADTPTPAGMTRAVLADPLGDATLDAPDIERISVAQDADAMLEVVVECVGGAGNLDLYIDSDFNDATGEEGFDVRVSASAATGALELWVQEGGAWTADSPPTFSGSLTNGKLVMRVHRQYLGLEGSRGPVAVVAASSGDRAPDNAPVDRLIFRPL